jgi:WD40 repeat protein
VNAVAVSKNGVLAATGGADKNIRVYTLADGKTIGTIPAPAAIRGLSFSPNSLTLAATCDNGTVAVWNVAFVAGQPMLPEFGRPVQSFAHAMPATSVVFAGDNATIYSSSADKSAKVWKVPAAGATQSLAHPNLVDSLAFDPTGNRLATGCHDGQLRIWDLTKTPQPVITKAIVAHAAKGQEPTAIYAVAWTPDGKQVLSGSFDRTLKLWDPTSGALVREFKAHDTKVFPKGHQLGVFSAAFSPDGKFLVSGGDDRIINIWNTADGSVVRQLLNPNLKANQPDAKGQLPQQPPQAHPGAIYGARFLPDGKHILSAGHAPRNQGFLALWSAADGKLVYAADLPTGHINSLAVSTDGKLLAIAAAPRERLATAANGFILRMPDAAK